MAHLSTVWNGRHVLKFFRMKKETSKKIVEFVHSHPEVWMPKSKTSGYNCPICQNGTGEDGTGAESKDGVHFICRKCNSYRGADIFDIMGIKKGVSDFPSKLKYVIEVYKGALLAHGFTSAELDMSAPPTPPKGRQSHLISQIKQRFSVNDHPQQQTVNNMDTASSGLPQQPPRTPVESKPEIDRTDECNKFHDAIGETDYLTKRGLSRATLDRFNVGYCKAWVHPEPKDPTKEQHPHSVVTIPTSKFTYAVRYIGFKGHSHVGRPRRLFNVDALYNSDKPVFIVEGEIDAMSIVEVGGCAVGLGGTSEVPLLLNTIKERKPTQPLIIALDNDPNNHGQEVQKNLCDELATLGIQFQEANIGAEMECKDANDALIKDHDKFAQLVADLAELTKCAIADQMDTMADEIRVKTVAYALDGFLSRVEASKNNVVYQTLFKNLDDALDGGLYAGLYVIGAISSLGKTTFCLQIADQLAFQGHDVLIFSLEMSRDELIAKSLSRLTFLFTDDRHNAKTTRGILSGSRYDRYNNAEKALIDKAIDAYRSFGHHVYIREGLGDVTTKMIRESVLDHVNATGKAPIVIIDYLQIIASPPQRGRNLSDKQVIDRAVLDLKILSRDFNIPVIAISSFNRNNYDNPANLASFKESGAIEYSSDVLIGLQYKDMDNEDGEYNESVKRKTRVQTVKNANTLAGRMGNAQQIQVKILKNRNGSRGNVDLYFTPMFNCFSVEEHPHSEWHNFSDE